MCFPISIDVDSYRSSGAKKHRLIIRVIRVPADYRYKFYHDPEWRSKCRQTLLSGEAKTCPRSPGGDSLDGLRSPGPPGGDGLDGH